VWVECTVASNKDPFTVASNIDPFTVASNIDPFTVAYSNSSHCSLTFKCILVPTTIILPTKKQYTALTIIWELKYESIIAWLLTGIGTCF